MLTEVNYVDGGGGGVSAASGTGGESYPTDGKFTLGFKPKKLFVSLRYNNSASIFEFFYDEDISTTTQERRLVMNNQYYKNTSEPIQPSTTEVRIGSIDTDGFTLASAVTASNSAEIYYVAVG